MIKVNNKVTELPTGQAGLEPATDCLEAVVIQQLLTHVVVPRPLTLNHQGDHHVEWFPSQPFYYNTCERVSTPIKSVP